MADDLKVELTVGWPEEGLNGADAGGLHELAGKSSGGGLSYEQALLQLLQDQNVEHIDNLDHLLRRRGDGFSAIKDFTAALLDIKDKLPQFKCCRIDVFAFAFLKYAKNYDLFMTHDEQSDLKETVENWQEAVQALEDFERLGEDPGDDYADIKEIYLKARAAVSRPSARDEQRTLAVLLGSGPSTLDDIGIDLGLNYSLNRRIMVALEKADVITSRGNNGDTQYLVKEKALPVALFLVRETIGLDFLTMAAGLWEEY